MATLQIRAIEVTDSATGDAPIMPYLLDQNYVNETVASVSGDLAYHTKSCHVAIAQRGAQAAVLTGKNAKPCKDQRPGAKTSNAFLAATRWPDREICKKWSG